MKICFSLLLLFLCGTVAKQGSVVVKGYEYESSPSTWYEAQSHCRSKFTDLGTIFQKSDEETNLKSYFAWISLDREKNNWVWFDGCWIPSRNAYSADNCSNSADSCPVFYSRPKSADSFPVVSYSGPKSADSCPVFYSRPKSADSCPVVSYSSKVVTGYKCDEYAFFYCETKGGGNQFTFVPESKTMTEAEAHCDQKNLTLASFGGGFPWGSELKEQDFPVWTGLHREGGSWKWSYGLSEYENWASGEPSNKGDCVAISSQDKKMSALNCSARFPFVCLSTNLLLVKENKTWEEALDHCRALGSVDNRQYDLVSVQPGDEYVTTVVQEADTEEVWVGLRFLAGSWLWVNGATLLYPDLPPCPPLLQRCGALPKSSNRSDDFVLADCVERRNFLCYRKQ